MGNAQISNVAETASAGGCATRLLGVRTIADSELFVVALPQDMWTDLDTCGNVREVLGFRAQILCWQCGLENGLIRISEQEHVEEEERFLRNQAIW